MGGLFSPFPIFRSFENSFNFVKGAAHLVRKGDQEIVVRTRRHRSVCIKADFEDSVRSFGNVGETLQNREIQTCRYQKPILKKRRIKLGKILSGNDFLQPGKIRFEFYGRIKSHFFVGIGSSL